MSFEKSDTLQVNQILPQSGELYYEPSTHLSLCQSHLMPLKSLTLKKLEKLQKDADRKYAELKKSAEEGRKSEEQRTF